MGGMSRARVLSRDLTAQSSCCGVVRGRPRTSRSSLPRRALTDLGFGLLPLAACALTTSRLLGLPSQYFFDVAGDLCPVGGSHRAPHAVGPACARGWEQRTRITLVRATLVVPAAALVLQPGPHEATALWWIAGVAAVAIALDGLDGLVARRSGQETQIRGALRHGARLFPDARAVGARLARPARADAWVLLLGAPRYLFVAAGWIWSSLTAELPPSFRRKTVCVVQGVALIVCLLPVMPVEHVPSAAAGALALLTWSFGVDVIWLIVHAPGRVRPRRA